MKKLFVTIIAAAMVLSALAAMAQDEKNYTITPKIAYTYLLDGDSRDVIGSTFGILVDGTISNIPVGLEVGYIWGDKNLYYTFEGVDYTLNTKTRQVPVLVTYSQAFIPESPFYFTVGAGVSFNHWKQSTTFVSGSGNTTKFAYKAAVGYKFAETWNAELALVDNGKFADADNAKTQGLQLSVGYTF